MAYMEFPGVEYTEKNWDSSSAIEGGATDTCGVIIIAQKGPINTPTLVHSLDQAIEKFGTYIEQGYGMYSIKGFFQNGGNALYISRVAHYADITDKSTLTAKKASLSLKDKRESGAEDTLTFIDKYHGSLGNKHGIKIIDTPSVTTTVEEAVEKDATAIKCKNVRDFVAGDYVTIKDKSSTDKSEVAHIISIDVANKQINLESAITNTYTVGSEVNTLDFTVEAYYKSVSGDQLEATFVGVNMNPKSEKYIITVMSDATKGTKLFDIVDEYIDVENVYEKIPKATDIVYATGGNDGLDDFSDMDIIGDPASKTGLYAFDNIREMIQVWCPESASKEVIQAGYDYWTNRMSGMYFATVPNGLDPDAAATFRDESGFNTSYGALYHNWGYVIDPIGIGNNPKKLIPLTGHVLGAVARNDSTNVDEYGSAPAGESMVLLGVDSLEFDVDRTNGGIMYGNKDRNINPIVTLSNNGGIAVWGSRTQSNDAKWRQILARRVFIYVELAIAEGTRWCAFRNKNDTLYNQLTRSVTKFLRGVKGLYGDTDADRFEFVTGTTINDEKDPYVISRIGLNITGVGEFIYFEFGHKPEGISLAEI